MRITVTNRQTLCRANVRRIRDLLLFLMRRACGSAPGTAWAEIALLLGDDAVLSDANRRIFGRSGPTDVISLRYAPAPRQKGASGEILVNVQRALAVGPRYWRGRPGRELALYIAHGCDHLQGANDRGRAARMRMRRRELRWIREAAAAGLPVALLPPADRPKGGRRGH